MRCRTRCGPADRSRPGDARRPGRRYAADRGQPLLLAEALVNILDNAIEYAGRGGEITVGVQRDGGHVLVSVSDNGPGIPPADHARVFDRFVRATDQG
jgi:two-component system sensor histidine kinase TctE